MSKGFAPAIHFIAKMGVVGEGDAPGSKSWWLGNSDYPSAYPPHILHVGVAGEGVMNR